jgi:trehalose synthase
MLGIPRPYVEQYSAAIFSMPEFAQQLPIAQYGVPPSIDPLSDKNRPLAREDVMRVFEKYQIDPARPLLTQISRFDRLKDPLGVIAAYRLVKKRHDCHLLLAGGGATDDPEGAEVLKEVQEAAASDPDIHVLLLPPFSDLEINALVRGSTVVIQSLREGFGSAVSEPMKKKPVVAGAVGGIKIQVIDGVTGFLVHSVEGAATQIAQLLRDRRLRERMGENGYEHVKQNFLLTRHVKEYMLAMLAMEHPGESVVHLN